MYVIVRTYNGIMCDSGKTTGICLHKRMEVEQEFFYHRRAHAYVHMLMYFLNYLKL